ncbi:hypothetical protein BOFL111202_06185 [Bordetella flabilis]
MPGVFPASPFDGWPGVRRIPAPIGRLACPPLQRMRDFALLGLQAIIPGEVHHEFPRQWLELAQAFIDHHTAFAVDDDRRTVRRITQMARCATGRPELRHDARQPLRPIAGAKALTFFRNTENNELSHAEYRWFCTRGRARGAPSKTWPEASRAAAPIVYDWCFSIVSRDHRAVELHALRRLFLATPLQRTCFQKNRHNDAPGRRSVPDQRCADPP